MVNLRNSRQEELFQKWKEEVKNYLLISKLGICHRKLEYQLADTLGKSVPYRDFGHNWGSFLYEIRDIFDVGVHFDADPKNPGSKFFLFIRDHAADEDTSHLLQFVKGQEKGKPKKRRDGLILEPTRRQVRMVSAEHLNNSRGRPATATSSWNTPTTGYVRPPVHRTNTGTYTQGSKTTVGSWRAPFVGVTSRSSTSYVQVAAKPTPTISANPLPRVVVPSILRHYLPGGSESDEIDSLSISVVFDEPSPSKAARTNARDPAPTTGIAPAPRTTILQGKPATLVCPRPIEVPSTPRQYFRGLTSAAPRSKCTQRDKLVTLESECPCPSTPRQYMRGDIQNGDLPINGTTVHPPETKSAQVNPLLERKADHANKSLVADKPVTLECPRPIMTSATPRQYFRGFPSAVPRSECVQKGKPVATPRQCMRGDIQSGNLSINGTTVPPSETQVPSLNAALTKPLFERAYSQLRRLDLDLDELDPVPIDAIANFEDPETSSTSSSEDSSPVTRPTWILRIMHKNKIST